MCQRSIVLDFHQKQLAAQAIHADRVATLGPKAVAYDTVRHSLRKAKAGVD
jgi:hypothetical protein